MGKKIISVHIDDDDFPMLSNIKDDVLGDMCYDIFKMGYDCYFPNIEDSTFNKTINSHTGILKNEISQLRYQLEDKNIDSKIENFTDVVNDLFGINANSARRGKVGEDLVYTLIKTKFKDYSIEVTRGKHHSGDAIVTIPPNSKRKKFIKVMVEIKNYTKSVDSDELDKLLYDMDHTGIDNALFISMQSSFVGKKRLSIERYDKKTIIFVPYAVSDSNKIENSLIMIERLIDFGISNSEIDIGSLYNNINHHLQELDVIYRDYSEMKSHFLKLEKSIRDSLTDHYNIIRENEIKLKKSINSVWNRINKDFHNFRSELLASNKMDDIIKDLKSHKYKHLKLVLEIVLKHGCHIETFSDTIDGDGCWPLYKDGECIGSITKNRSLVELSLSKPYKCTIEFPSDSNKDKLSKMTKILNSTLEIL